MYSCIYVSEETDLSLSLRVVIYFFVVFCLKLFDNKVVLYALNITKLKKKWFQIKVLRKLDIWDRKYTNEHHSDQFIIVYIYCDCDMATK